MMKCPRCGGDVRVMNTWLELGIVVYGSYCPKCRIDFTVRKKV